MRYKNRLTIGVAARQTAGMTTVGKMMRTGMAAALLLTSIATGAQGFFGAGGGGGTSGVGVSSRGMVQIDGKLLCAGCRLEEVRQGQPDLKQLYHLTHKRGEVVLQVRAVNPSERRLPWSSKLAVRSKDSVFEQLTAEENMFKQVRITGILRNTRTLDIIDVTVHG